MTQKEYKKWYSSCEFIQQTLQFYSYQDFVANCFIIKKLFKSLNNRTKKLYQWYVFANHINYTQKCLIWNYLNDYNSYKDLLSNSPMKFRTKK